MFRLILAVTFVAIAAVAAEDADAHAEIKSYKNEIEPDGNYVFGYETSNGIAFQEAGNEHGAHGAFEFISHEGKPFKVEYEADEHGFYPKAEHLPSQLAHAIEYLRAHPESVEEHAPGKKF